MQPRGSQPLSPVAGRSPTPARGAHALPRKCPAPLSSLASNVCCLQSHGHVPPFRPFTCERTGGGGCPWLCKQQTLHTTDGGDVSHACAVQAAGARVRRSRLAGGRSRARAAPWRPGGGQPPGFRRRWWPTPSPSAWGLRRCRRRRFPCACNALQCTGSRCMPSGGWGRMQCTSGFGWARPGHGPARGLRGQRDPRLEGRQQVRAVPRASCQRWTIHCAPPIEERKLGS